MQKNKQFFYGWWMVVVITVLFLTGQAAPLGIILKQLMEQFQTGRGEVSLSQSIFMIAMGITGIFVGRLLPRYRPRMFLLWGSVASGIASLLLSLSPSLWFLYVFYFIAGVAGGFSNAIAMFTILSRWFSRKWGTAIGIATAGGSVGGMLVQPLVGVISQKFGWQATYLFSGALILAVNVPLILFVLKDSPESMGLAADGDTPHETTVPGQDKLTVKTNSGSTPAVKNPGLFSYFKNPALWLVGICFAFAALGSTAITTHEVSFITDMNVSATMAAWARGVTLGIGAISALASGWLSDRLMSRYVAILFFLFAIFGMLILIPANAMSQVWIFTVIYGLGIGASGTLLPIVTRDIFGPANFSALFGFIVVLFAVGAAIGSTFAGFMFDATGSYRSVFIILTALYALSILLVYFAFGAKPKPLVRASAAKKQD
jgi:sugar phosphate permease